MAAKVDGIIPNWKLFVELGEEFLKQHDTPSLLNVILNKVREYVPCAAHVWLVEPFFPLPGENHIPTIPSTTPPPAVQQAYQNRAIYCSPSKTASLDDCDPETSHQIALPLITQEAMLGVLLVERPEGELFRTNEIEFLQGLASHAAIALQVTRQVLLKNWRYEQLNLVHSVSAQIANLPDLDELFRRVVNLIQCSFNYYFVVIYTFGQDKSELLYRASSRDCEPRLRKLFYRADLGKGIIGYVATTGEEFYAPDVREEPRYLHSERLPETLSEISIPIKVENRILGVLDVQSNQVDAFHEIDIMVLHSLADSIALAIEGAALYNDLHRRVDQISALFDVSQAITSILDPDELLKTVVQVIQKSFSYSHVNVYTLNYVQRKIIFQAGSGKRSRALQNRLLSFDLDAPRGILPWVARNGMTRVLNDVSKDELYIPSILPPRDTKSEIALPLKFGDTIYGVLDIQTNRLNSFDLSDISILESLAAAIAVALRNATVFRSEEWRRRVSDSFRDVALMLSQNSALDDMLDTILTKLENLLPCDCSAIWLADENYTGDSMNAHLSLAAVHGLTPEQIITARDSSEEIRAWLGSSLGTSTPRIRTEDDPIGPLGAAAGYPKNYSSIGVPLRAGDAVLGILTLAHHTPRRYGPEASLMTSTFASYAAVAIQSARLFASAQSEAWTSSVLLQVSEALQNITSADILFTTISRLMPFLVGVNRCALFTWEEAQAAFQMKSSFGIRDSRINDFFSAADLPGFFQLRATRSPVFIRDPQQELNLGNLLSEENHTTVLLLPLISRGELLGAFLVTHEETHSTGLQNTFTKQMLLILQGIAHQTSIALENIRLVENRQEEAYVTAVLLQVAQAVVSQNNLHDILDTIIHLLPILIGVDDCLVYLWDHNQQVFTLEGALREEWLNPGSAVLSYRPGQYPLLDAVHKSDTIVTCSLDSTELSPLEWPEVKCLTPGNMSPASASAAVGNWLVGFPLSIKGEVYGILVTKESNVPTAFHDRRLEIMNGVAQQVALAVQNEQLNLEMVNRERFEREIQLARQIQETFLPSRIPYIQDWEIDLRWKPAREVGGDFYDLLDLKDGRRGFSIADVSDKGVPAALYMTVTRTLLRAYAQGQKSPAKVLEKVNNLMAADSQNGMFVTAIYTTLFPATGKLLYANAGHNLPVLMRAKSKALEILPKGSIALGVLENALYHDQVIEMDPGDMLFFYTDGVTDTFSPTGEAFGMERLLKLLQNSIGQDTHSILVTIDNQLKDFRKNTPPSDDITIVALRRLA